MKYFYFWHFKYILLITFLFFYLRRMLKSLKKKDQNRCSRTGYIIFLFHAFFFLVKPWRLHYPQYNSTADSSVSDSGVLFVIIFFIFKLVVFRPKQRCQFVTFRAAPSGVTFAVKVLPKTCTQTLMCHQCQNQNQWCSPLSKRHEYFFHRCNYGHLTTSCTLSNAERRWKRTEWISHQQEVLLSETN